MPLHFPIFVLQNLKVRSIYFTYYVILRFRPLHLNIRLSYKTTAPDFLKNKAPPGIYNSIYPKFLKIARQLKVAIQPDFGIRPKIEHPSIFETMQASGNYSVRLLITFVIQLMIS